MSQDGQWIIGASGTNVLAWNHLKRTGTLPEPFILPLDKTVKSICTDQAGLNLFVLTTQDIMGSEPGMGTHDWDIEHWQLTSEGLKAKPELLAKGTNQVEDLLFDRKTGGLLVSSASEQRDGCFVGRLASHPVNTALVAPATATIPDNLAGMSVSEDGRWLGVMYTSEVDLWDLGSLGALKKPVFAIGYERAPNAIAMSGSGTRMIVTTLNEAHLFDLRDKDNIPQAIILRAHEKNSFVQAVDLSRDGRWCVTGDDDGNVKLWPLQIEDLIKLGASAVGRNLSSEEWKLYFPNESYRRTFPAFPDPPTENALEAPAKEAVDEQILGHPEPQIKDFSQESGSQ
jgi:hypothetical protein